MILTFNNKERFFIKDKINDLRDKLNKEMGKRCPNDEKILKISQELDLLIVEYYNNINILTENDNISWFIN